MSKYIKSSLAIGTPDPVNLNETFSFQKFESVGTKEKEGKFQIIFMRNQNQITGPQDVRWKYKCKCDRDAEYDKILEMNTVTL